MLTTKLAAAKGSGVVCINVVAMSRAGDVEISAWLEVADMLTGPGVVGVDDDVDVALWHQDGHADEQSCVSAQ